jgi:hypothetical protein
MLNNLVRMGNFSGRHCKCLMKKHTHYASLNEREQDNYKTTIFINGL